VWWFFPPLYKKCRPKNAERGATPTIWEKLLEQAGPWGPIIPREKNSGKNVSKGRYYIPFSLSFFRPNPKFNWDKIPEWEKTPILRKKS